MPKGDYAISCKINTRKGSERIIRAAFESSVPLIDLRLVCSEPGDYANPIEPSVQGGAKIARAIERVLGAERISTDIAYTARINGYASTAEFIAAHAGAPWFVSMVGFVAGLPFLYQMVDRQHQIQSPKYLRPRTDTPKLTVGHGGLGEADLDLGQSKPAPVVATTGPCGGKAGDSALPDQLALVSGEIDDQQAAAGAQDARRLGQRRRRVLRIMQHLVDDDAVGAAVGAEVGKHAAGQSTSPSGAYSSTRPEESSDQPPVAPPIAPDDQQ